MARRFLTVGSAVCAVFLACSDSDLLQGDTYKPDNELPIDPATARPEGGLDASESDAAPLPMGDAATLPSNTCAAPHDFGKVSGDTGADSLDVDGTCSEWFSFRATEDSNTPVGRAMNVKITMTPAGADFDLYVYIDPIRDEIACASPFKTSTTAGTGPETVSLTWGEGSISNGSNDSRTVRIAVIRPGPCDAGSFSLRVEGNRS